MTVPQLNKRFKCLSILERMGIPNSVLINIASNINKNDFWIKGREILNRVE